MSNQGRADLERLLEGLDARRSGAGWSARCPSHDDRTPSLSIAYVEGRILVHCHAGCSQEAVVGELIRLGLWPRPDRPLHRRVSPAQPLCLPQRQYAAVTSHRDFGLRPWDQGLPLLEEPWPPVLERYFQA